MLDSIFIGMSGLTGYSRGLRVIANNTANLNTPGFKGSALQFGDLFYASGPASGHLADAGVSQLGQGLTTYSTSMDFSQGELRQTGNDLDLAVDGQGLFVLKDENGVVRYTRDGEFKFDESGILVSRSTGAKVLARDESGAMVELSLANLRSNPAKATTAVNFSGNLSSTETSHSLSDVTVHDEVGAVHHLSVEFTNSGTDPTTQTRTWKVAVKDGATEVGMGTLSFLGGDLDASTAKISIDYHPSGAAAMPMTFDFSSGVTSFALGSNSSLAATKEDGYTAGALTSATFDNNGVLQLGYSNGQTSSGARLALVRFESADAVRATGDNMFEAVDAAQWEQGTAQTGAFGSVRSGVVEISNVDLSSEFSNLVIMQRGYQASSQIVSTANEMIQELFSLKGR